MSTTIPIVISALGGGAAEAVLRSIGRDCEGSRISRIGFSWRNPAQGVSIGEGKLRVNLWSKDRKQVVSTSFEDVLLVVGDAVGLFLEDRWLPRNQCFSLSHSHSSLVERAHYVISISTNLKESSDLRRAANEICAFGLKHFTDDFKKIRKVEDDAERERLARRKNHLDTYLREKSMSEKRSNDPLERFACLW